jgi:NADPH:quinone reductase-like Zn-dependent oxidoreductase
MTNPNMAANPTPALPKTMTGVVLTGHGGVNKLHYRTDLPVPSPGPNEVLIRVAAAGINNTDINTRIGWYSKSVKTGTSASISAPNPTHLDTDASWTGAALQFPRIQGADCCGHIVAVGSAVDAARIGERVLVAALLRHYVGHRAHECWTFGSECDGAFAQYAVAPACETFAVQCAWSDVELASVPCAYSTAENMLHRAGVGRGERVLITGASGGVGSAAVQLAKRRGAEVVAVVGREKVAQMGKLGVDLVIPRGESVVGVLGAESVDVVVDLVAGPSFAELLDALKRGGRYAVAGAIAGPIVELDVRTLYLKDLSFFGCTFQDDVVFPNLVSYIERGEIRPHVAKVFELRDIAAAQEEFISKAVSGKLVLTIPKE